MSAIELQHIIKNFKTPTSDVEVLKDVSFTAVFRWCLGRLVQEKVRF